jgi:hypothetical protein
LFYRPTVGQLSALGVAEPRPQGSGFRRGLQGQFSMERIETAIRAAASERPSRHLNRLPEVVVVEDVEKIRSRLKNKPLVELIAMSEIFARSPAEIRREESAKLVLG